MNKPNQKAAITRAGTSVVRNALIDVEPPIPSPPATSELEELESPRDEPTFGSLLGSCLFKISAVIDRKGLYHLYHRVLPFDKETREYISHGEYWVNVTGDCSP